MGKATAAFYVGSLPVHSELILAPMDGISDMPFRRLCRRFGSGMSYIPFLHAREILQDLPRKRALLRYHDDERPIVFQIYDNIEDNLVQAATRLQQYRPDAIDINMGCSIRSISARGAGAGLLRDPAKVGRIIRRLSTALPIPVTAKIRIGWDTRETNYLEIARILEENGAALIAVHARTCRQSFSGEADWDAIAAIKQAVKIPVIGNGDVRTVADIERLKSHSRCDAVMIGRAAIGNPWIFVPRPRGSVSLNEVSAVVGLHLESMLQHYPEYHAVKLFRKHLVRYIEPLSLPASMRELLLKSCDKRTLQAALRQVGLANPCPGV